MPRTATSPDTTAAATARTRKYSTIAGCPSRSASAIRYTDARNAHTATAITPPSTDVGFTQLVNQSPASPPLGTRPDAIAPATAPMQYGTSTDEAANIAP